MSPNVINSGTVRLAPAYNWVIQHIFNRKYLMTCLLILFLCRHNTDTRHCGLMHSISSCGETQTLTEPQCLVITANCGLFLFYFNDSSPWIIIFFFFIKHTLPRDLVILKSCWYNSVAFCWKWLSVSWRYTGRKKPTKHCLIPNSNYFQL